MPQTCSICGHADRTAIEAAIAHGEPLRAIAGRFGVSRPALARHRDRCGALAVAAARDVQDGARQTSVEAELRGVLGRITLLFEACDAYLRDSADPARYDIGPRAEDIQVTYTVLLDKELKIRIKQKARLSELVARIEGDLDGVKLVGSEYKIADPRKLVLATAAQLTRQLELLAKLTGELDETPQVNILVHPDWLALRDRILDALAHHPAALEEVSRALGEHRG